VKRSSAVWYNKDTSREGRTTERFAALRSTEKRRPHGLGFLWIHHSSGGIADSGPI
jgi:hypothetical protein